MRVASLFSGIGGFELGLEAQDDLALINDIDAAAQAVLAKRFPNVPFIEDVANVSVTDLRDADLLVAGFPCQDVSIVGGQKGLNGERTPLVKHVFRLAQQARPDRLLLENVQSIRFVHGGRVLAHLMDEAERLGYAWAYRTLDSHAFGLPQRRRRFYFLASRVDDPGEVLLSDPGKPVPKTRLDLGKPIGFYWTEGRAGHGLTEDALPPVKSGSAIGIASPPAVLMPDGAVVVPTIETAERLQGFPAGWTDAAPLRSRWRLVGNSVSPPVVRWLGERIKDPRPWQRVPSGIMSKDVGLPTAAWGDGKGNRRQVMVFEGPSVVEIGKLSQQKFDWSPISSRALKGFVTRAKSSRLRYPSGFLEKLELALERL
ncbi:DNA (cytosine-5-)-methyltransferase [Methylocystis sp. JR02]|uniref:DNA cytosine methyltransferase n=1 Tax=Methylocystis sp. JR02 TaxID=3046284 RepID=UPI0024B89D75|nr:DNA (cytosine-5-)-methyltransferase [Methylocystis sp. JR02]MDJ0449260.1 DNA (cytosine-5-)-methyltransferase [Methylocystis sp. JR02]